MNEDVGERLMLAEWVRQWPHYKCTDDVVAAMSDALAALAASEASVKHFQEALEAIADGYGHAQVIAQQTLDSRP